MVSAVPPARAPPRQQASSHFLRVCAWVGGGPPRRRVLGPDMSLVASSNELIGEDVVRLPRAALQASTAGTFYLQIMGFAPRMNKYSLTVSACAVACGLPVCRAGASACAQEKRERWIAIVRAGLACVHASNSIRAQRLRLPAAISESMHTRTHVRTQRGVPCMRGAAQRGCSGIWRAARRRCPEGHRSAATACLPTTTRRLHRVVLTPPAQVQTVSRQVMLRQDEVDLMAGVLDDCCSPDDDFLPDACEVLELAVLKNRTADQDLCNVPPNICSDQVGLGAGGGGGNSITSEAACLGLQPPPHTHSPHAAGTHACSAGPQPAGNDQYDGGGPMHARTHTQTPVWVAGACRASSPSWC